MSNKGTTKCTPEEESFAPFSFETPDGWEDFGPDDSTFHDYWFEDDAGANDEEHGECLEEELIRSPTNDENPATEERNTNDVGPPLPWSGPDEVTSYTTNDGIANVAHENHAVRSGFVVRKGVPDGRRGYKIVTYGEGNNRWQTLLFADGRERTLWSRNTKLLHRGRASDDVKNARNHTNSGKKHYCTGVFIGSYFSLFSEGVLW